MASPDLQLSYPHASGAALLLAKSHSAEHPLKLYGGWFCPFVQRVWIVMVEKNIPHQYIEINPYHKPPELLRLNPRGLIPTLEVPNRPSGLYESMVVCGFLNEAYGGLNLMEGMDAWEKARCRMWINHVETRIVPAWYEVMQAQGEGEEERKKLREAVEAFAGEMYKRSDRGGPWFLGRRFSLVDVSLAPWAKRLWLIDHYKNGGTGIPKREEATGPEAAVWDFWHRWLHAIKERPSVVRTWSKDEKYIGVYKRYVDNTTESEVAKATREGKMLP